MKRIIGLSTALLLLCLLQACSAFKIAYNRSPDLAYWYLDSYLNFTSVQSLQVREELAKLQAWHRQSQLPAYIDTLQKLQQQLGADVDAAQTCAVFADVRRKLLAFSSQIEPAVSALADSLSSDQLAQMERKFAQGNADYRDDFMDHTPQAKRDQRYKLALSRAEMLYGRLADKQRALLGKWADQSRFDATLSYAERLRRQSDTVQSLRALVAGRAGAVDSTDKTRATIKALLERSLDSPDASYRDYMDKLTQDNCKTFADLHNSTTPAQRARAVETLNGYAQDLRVLAAQTRG